MKRDNLNEALNQISDRHIAEAAAHKRTRTVRWIGAIAAILAVVLVVNFLGQPMLLSAKAVAVASESRAMERPNYQYYDTFKTYEEYKVVWDKYRAEQDARSATAAQARDNLADFFAESSSTILASNDGGNRVWSPINGYIALAMLAEVTGGSSRGQILELLNTPDLETLRSQVSAVWETVYQDDGKEISVLANSLWLDKEMTYDQQVMDDLAYHYYASVYQGKLDSNAVRKDLQAWLNKNTGNLLKEYSSGVQLPEDTVLTLASTVYLQSKWVDDFSKSMNTEGVFHTPGGNVDCTFMNKKEYQTYYYWGDSYGAVRLGLENGCDMWFFLPDEGKSVDDVLAERQYLEAISAPYDEEAENMKYMLVNLSVPKFDVGSQDDLAPDFQSLGITDVFSAQTSDFTPALGDTPYPVWLSGVQQAARVAIDEEGVVAASYIVLPAAGAAQPPEEIIDFILDRPFLFVITKNQLPLFTGVVNDP